MADFMVFFTCCNMVHFFSRFCSLVQFQSRGKYHDFEIARVNESKQFNSNSGQYFRLETGKANKWVYYDSAHWPMLSLQIHLDGELSTSEGDFFSNEDNMRWKVQNIYHIYLWNLACEWTLTIQFKFRAIFQIGNRESKQVGLLWQRTLANGILTIHIDGEL